MQLVVSSSPEYLGPARTLRARRPAPSAQSCPYARRRADGHSEVMSGIVCMVNKTLQDVILQPPMDLHGLWPDESVEGVSSMLPRVCRSVGLGLVTSSGTTSASDGARNENNRSIVRFDQLPLHRPYRMCGDAS
jgi:hypothetical protein